MSRLFGWDLPPGCSTRDIDRAFGGDGPLDCPICADGVELNGPDCMVDADPCGACNGTGEGRLDVELTQALQRAGKPLKIECPSCGGTGKFSKHGPTCPKHGCIVCQDLEKQRVIPEEPPPFDEPDFEVPTEPEPTE